MLGGMRWLNAVSRSECQNRNSNASAETVSIQSCDPGFGCNRVDQSVERRDENGAFEWSICRRLCRLCLSDRHERALRPVPVFECVSCRIVSVGKNLLIAKLCTC